MLRHNINTRIFTTRSYVWPIKKNTGSRLAPEQFSKIAEGSGDFAWARVGFEFRFHLGHPLLLAFVLARVLTSLLKTRLRETNRSFGKREA